MRNVLLLALVVPAVAHASPRPAVTRDEIRVDREIGDGNGYVDDLELAVARASYDVHRTTGMNIRPRLAYLKNVGGYETRDGYGPRVYIARAERPETVAFTVFHEAGHVAYRHDLSVDNRDHELWADYYAGELVAATHGDIRAALIDYGLRNHDALHGTPQVACAALLLGFIHNHGVIP